MKNNEVFSEKERNFIVLMIVLLLGAVLVYALRGIFGAILGTFLMYTLFRNLNVFLIEKWKWNNSLSAVFIIILSIFIIVLPILGIGTMLYNKAIAIQNDPQWIKQLVDTINGYAGDMFGKAYIIKVHF